LLSSEYNGISSLRYQYQYCYQCEENDMAPPKRDTHGVLVRLPASMIRAIDELCGKAGDDPSRPEMIRRILAKHLGMENEPG
jgi:hypothetical protein